MRSLHICKVEEFLNFRAMGDFVHGGIVSGDDRDNVPAMLMPGYWLPRDYLMTKSIDQINDVIYGYGTRGLISDGLYLDTGIAPNAI